MVAAGKHLSLRNSYKQVEALARDIVKQLVDFDPDFKKSSKDKVFMYATEVLTLGLL